MTPNSASGKVVLGCTSYHDIVPALQRVEIGWTWYAQSVQRSHVNTTCKLLLLTHAFETLGAEKLRHQLVFKTIAWAGAPTTARAAFNFKSQAAIERLGAKWKDGVIRLATTPCAATAPCATP